MSFDNLCPIISAYIYNVLGKGTVINELSATEKVFFLLNQKGILRPCELDEYHIPRRYLSRLYQRGLLERTSRGVYVHLNPELSEHQSMVEASKRIPKGIICLLSALSVHEISTQSPFEVWLTIDRKAWRPRIHDLPIRIVRSSGEALSSGISYHEYNGVSVPVYNPAKTIVDCFKYRNKIGLDVALEALRDGWMEKKFTMDEIHRYSKACRMKNVMRPYLEALSA
ncbi:MAG: type IV toxin-antitoxin system AbiEi family antitoxin domain-containing protein [Mariprofundaceae bacterium]|nr:type IV toxin-antitoxin system AbiEi family antitoxin domain-containing protein [Mariprofundaceae bacterium]